MQREGFVRSDPDAPSKRHTQLTQKPQSSGRGVESCNLRSGVITPIITGVITAVMVDGAGSKPVTPVVQTKEAIFQAFFCLNDVKIFFPLFPAMLSD